MTSLVFTEDGHVVDVGPDQPLPVYTDPSTAVVGVRSTVVNRQSQVPGIGTAAAYANLDQMGTVGVFANVPTAGIIREFRFLDFDNEGIDKIVWLFTEAPALAADNAAFSLADQYLHYVVGVFQFSTWRAAVNCQLGLTNNTPCFYNLNGSSSLYFAVETLGADNIAAGATPELQLVIEAAQ